MRTQRGLPILRLHMQYQNPPLSTTDQAKLLLSRNLRGIDEGKLAEILDKVSYFRLRAYTHPYQDASKNFIRDDWNDIWSDYVFDERLRTLLYRALSLIEITFRAQIILNMSMSHGAFWYNDSKLFMHKNSHKKILDKLTDDWDRSKENFKDDFTAKYTGLPPTWMIIETTTFGGLSKIYTNILTGLAAKDGIGKYFNFRKHEAKILSSWIYNLTAVRNICTHHGRLFSVVFSSVPIYPQNPKFNMPKWPAQNRLFASICVMTYLFDFCNTDLNFDFRAELKALISTATPSQLRRMGFPAGWAREGLFASQSK